MPLGAADESKPAADGTVEAWGRSAGNPVGGWYGLRKGYRGRFGMYMPPLLEALGVAEVTRPDAADDNERLIKAVNPLEDLPAFQAFTSGIADRCEDPPAPAAGLLVGSYP